MTYGNLREIWLVSFENTDLESGKPIVFSTERQARDWAKGNTDRNRSCVVFRATRIAATYQDEPRWIEERPTAETP